jgi:hypothetical protein
MIYVNAYRVSRAYGGPEEGGWWYDVGEPMASVPIHSEHRKGKSFYVSDGVMIHDCDYCGGTGEVEGTESSVDDFTPQWERCQECGEVPVDCAVVNQAVNRLRDQLSQEVGRREELRVSIEKHFAAYFPEHIPHYE